MNGGGKIWQLLALVVTLGLLLVACGGGEAPSGGGGGEKVVTVAAQESPSAGGEGEAPAQGETAEQIPDILVIHPEAYDLEITKATNTYVYHVPMMVNETLDYLLQELKAKGWEELGQPTVMGHLATLNMKQEGYRLTVSLQDNEHSMSTRVQMLLMKQ